MTSQGKVTLTQASKEEEFILYNQLRWPVWSIVCQHIDGVAVGTTISAFSEHNVLKLLSNHPHLSLRQLSDSLGGNMGYLHVGLRLLVCQGWLTSSGLPGTNKMTFALTRIGESIAQLAPFYQQATSFFPYARALLQSQPEHNLFELISKLEEFRQRLEREWELPQDLGSLLRTTVCHHLNGHIVSPIMSILARKNILPPVLELTQKLDVNELDINHELMAQICDVLACLGWLCREKQWITFTPAGVIAMAYARQYWYPISYLETFTRVPELLFGNVLPPQNEAHEVETHVDRALDIKFSGAVFAKTCKQPFIDIAIPIFQQFPLSRQPVAVVDTGCGDGNLLKVLYEAIRDRSLRGYFLEEYPLIMVGVEPSPIARRVAAQTLTEANIPHYVIDGNIADPNLLVSTLKSIKIDPYKALHVSKSVIHNRSYSPPILQQTFLKKSLGSTGAFVLPDGSAIPNSDLERNLIEHFLGWRELGRMHGLLVIEAHTAAPQIITKCLGRTVATCLDATHGYSNQYLVEPDIFLSAAQNAGFVPYAHFTIGEETVGHTILTLTHFVLSDLTG